MKEKGPRETHLDELLEHLEGSGSPGSRTDDRKHKPYEYTNLPVERRDLYSLT